LFFHKAVFRCHQTQFHSVKYHRNADAAGDPPRTPLGELIALRRPPNCKELRKEKDEREWKAKKVKEMVGNGMGEGKGLERGKAGGKGGRLGPSLVKS